MTTSGPDSLQVAPQLGSVERRVVRVDLAPNEIEVVVAMEEALKKAESAVVAAASEGREASAGQERRLRGLALQLWQASSGARPLRVISRPSHTSPLRTLHDGHSCVPWP